MDKVVISSSKEILIRLTPKTMDKGKDISGKDYFRIPKGYIGSVPNWVVNHWYFKAHLDDGSITIYSGSMPKDSEIEASISKSAKSDEEKKKEALAKSQYDSQKEFLKKTLQNEAQEKGLSQKDTSEYIKAGLKKARDEILANI